MSSLKDLCRCVVESAFADVHGGGVLSQFHRNETEVVPPRTMIVYKSTRHLRTCKE